MTSYASHDALVMVVPMEQWAGQPFQDKSADLWVVMLSDHNEKYSDRMERSYKAFAVTFELRFPFPLRRTHLRVYSTCFLISAFLSPVYFLKNDEFTHNWTWIITSLQWRHNGQDSVSNHQPHDCLHNHLFRRTSKKTSKLRVTGLCAGNSPGTGEFPAQMASKRGKCFLLMTSSCPLVLCRM